MFCLCWRDLADHLGALAVGGRKIDRWYGGSLKVVGSPSTTRRPPSRNVNTRDELAEAARDPPAAAAGALRG